MDKKHYDFVENSDFDAEIEKCDQLLNNYDTRLEITIFNPLFGDKKGTDTLNDFDTELEKCAELLDCDPTLDTSSYDEIVEDENDNFLIDNSIVVSALSSTNYKDEKCLQLTIGTDDSPKAFKEIEKTSPKDFEETVKQENLEIGQNICKEVEKTETRDYFEDEKEDIIHPEWQQIKNLSTNEERYNQVRNCWKTCSIPDPNKNLTYHSYRKRNLITNNCLEMKPIKQHKRQASSSLNGRSAKRPCTFFLDKEINSVEKTKHIKKREIFKEMTCKINAIDGEICKIKNSCYFDDSVVNQHNRLNTEAEYIANQYNEIAKDCENSYNNQIYSLNERRDEILKFCNFYKGLNLTNDDPTVLSEKQFNELNEIENIYKQFDYYYRDNDN